MFTAVLFTATKIWKQPKCLSVDEWIAVVHLPNAILCSSKIESILLFLTALMDLDPIMLSEISQSMNDKYHIIFLKTGI